MLTVAVIWVASARAQAPNIQPFEDATPTPTPTQRAVRRAQPVAPTDPPVARAVPADPATGAPAATPRRRVPLTPANTAPTRTYPAPGDGGPDEPVAPTPRTDSPAPAATDATPAPRPATGTTRDIPAPGASPTVADPTSPAPGGEEGDEIRIAPQAGRPTVSADDTQFNLANRSYVAKDYAQAAVEYGRYLERFPEGKQRQAAMWWLGEAYRFQKRIQAARASYQNIIISYQEGEFVGPASFRMATIDYEARDYATALSLFRKAADLSKAQDVKLYARYSEALCLEQLNRKDETREIYEDILTFTANNPYRDDAHLKLADLAMSQHHPNDAFKQYEALSREALKPLLQAESTLKAGVLAHELGQDDTAMSLYARASAMPGATTQIRGDAMIAQLHLLYDTNKYKELLAAYGTMKISMPSTLQPEAMLMAGNSLRQQGRHQEAREVYDELITQFSGTAQAPEARYQRIISLYAADDQNFVREADDFLLGSVDATKTDQVRLMKADTLFKRRDYQAAALAYNALDGSVGLPAKYKAEAAYRLGYSYAQARQPEKTVSAFSRFLRNFPEHPFVAKALMQRGAAYQQLKNYSSALQDFSEVVNDHKDAKEREVAMAQRAVILGAQNESRGMIESFRALLKEYPNTEAAPVAHFSIANAAFNDLKDYTLALGEFDAARKASPKDYGPKSTLMMIFCEYQLKDKAKLTAEIAAYEKTKPATPVPPTILGWLGEQEFADKNYASAEEHLTAAATSPGATPDTQLTLARARVSLQKWNDALEAVQKYLASVASDPDLRAQGLLVQADAQIGLKQYDVAQKSVDETLFIQPEGKLNARALLLRGKLETAQGKFADAGKTYMSIAVLYDDEEVTPQALRQAAEVFEKAGQSAEAAKATDELKTRFPNFTAR